MKHQSSSLLRSALCLCAIFSVGFQFSCSKDKTSVTPPNNIRVTTTAKFGKVLTDSAGNTLYFFSNDAAATSTCTGGCIVTWPVFSTNSLTTDADLDKSDFSSILRTDGARQLTYKGWPLYYYQPDSLKSGNFKGDAVGNVWFVAKPDYTIMIAKGQLTGNDGVNYDSTYKAGTQKYAYFTDDFGRTLYSFTPDKNRKNNYTKSDFSNDATWPIYQVSPLTVPSIVNKALFDTIHVFGKVQLTFKGWPMYHFGPDNSVRGSTKGVSVPTPGIWPVMNQFSPTAPL